MPILIIGRKDSHAARRFREAADRKGVMLKVAHLSDLRFEIRNGVRSVFLGDIDICGRFDALFPLHFGPYFSETLMLCEWAASRGMRVIERPLSEGQYVSSKAYDAWKLAEAGLPVPETMQCMDMKDARRAFDALGTPLVAKGTHGGQGRWVFLVRSYDELASRLSGGQSGIFIFQRYLPIDEEYRVMTVGGKAVGAVRRNPVHGDFRRNFSVGATLDEAALMPQLRILAESASRVLGYAFAGVDIAMSAGKPYILEVNRRPGFKGFETVTDTDVAKAFIEYVTEDRNRRPAERGEVHALHGHHQEAG